MHFAPNEILLNMVVEFKGGASGDAILASIDRFERDIRDRFPNVRQIFIEAESLIQDIRAVLPDAHIRGDSNNAFVR